MKWRLGMVVLVGALACSSGASSPGAPPAGAYRELPALTQFSYACLTGNGTYILLRSEGELEELLALSKARRDCLGEPERLRAAVREAGVDFEREALLLIGEFYGGTGMAKARMSVSGPEEGTLTATIAVTVPPPPLTPDVAYFRFALAFEKAGVQRVAVVYGAGGGTGTTLLRLAGEGAAEVVTTPGPPQGPKGD